MDELDLVANAREVGAYFKSALADAVGANRFVGEVQQGDILGFAPPLCLTKEEGDIIVSATKAAIEAVATEL